MFKKGSIRAYIILAVCLILMLFPRTAFAANPDKYLGLDGVMQTANNPVMLTHTSTAWNSTWISAENTVRIQSLVRVSGNVNLILCDGAEITAEKGILVPEAFRWRVTPWNAVRWQRS